MEFLRGLVDRFRRLTQRQQTVVVALCVLVLGGIAVWVSPVAAALFLLLFSVALFGTLATLLVAVAGYLLQRVRGRSGHTFALLGVWALALMIVAAVGVAATVGPGGQMTDEERAERRQERSQEREQADRERTERAQANAERRAQEEREQQAQEEVREEEPEPVPEPEPEPEPEPSPQEQPEPEEEPEREQRTATPTNAYVADLLAIAERYGLECQRREVSDEMQDVLAGEQEERNCEGEDTSGLMYTMAMWSLVETGEVDGIALSLTDVDGRGFEHTASEFFGDVAATAASDPDAARTWISENIYDVDMEETEIGGVHYVLRGWPEIDGYDSWSLDIEATPIE